MKMELHNRQEDTTSEKSYKLPFEKSLIIDNINTTKNNKKVDDFEKMSYMSKGSISSKAHVL